jgi:hypothetical protein
MDKVELERFAKELSQCANFKQSAISLQPNQKAEG